MSYDVVILGAGISGITCAIYLKRAGIKTLIVESNVLGGQLNKANEIENFPGYSIIKGSEFVENLFEQLQKYKIDLIYGNVSKIIYDKKSLIIGDKCYNYKYLVFATGRREKTLNLERERELIGRGISFCATCDGNLYASKDVAVIGGGSTAVSEAIYLSSICRKVYVVYRGKNFRAENVLKDRLLAKSNVEFIYEDEVVDYLVDDNKLKGIRLKSNRDIFVSCVFLAIGHIPNSELFIGDIINGYILVDNCGRTNIDSIYACGDVIDKSIYQLITASNDGVVVANDIINELR